MRTLLLLPDSSSEVAPGAGGRGVRLDSPSTVFGTIEAEQARIISAVWSDLNGYEYTYLMAFYRTAAFRNAGEFLVDLPLRSSAFESCRAKFTGSPQAAGFTGGTASVSAQLAAMPASVPYPLSTAAQTLVGQITTEVF